MLGRKPSVILGSTSVRLNVNPYCGSRLWQDPGDAKIAFSAFVQKSDY